APLLVVAGSAASRCKPQAFAPGHLAASHALSHRVCAFIKISLSNASAGLTAYSLFSASTDSPVGRLCLASNGQLTLSRARNSGIGINAFATVEMMPGKNVRV